LTERTWGRATFYAHFENKEDLLLSGFETLRKSLKARQREAHLCRGGRFEERVLAFSHDLFAHVSDHRDLFWARAGKHSGAVVQTILRKLLDLVREDVKSLLPTAQSKCIPAEVVAEFIAGGIFGVLLWWMGSRARPSVDELNAIFQRLTIPVLKAALA
jgi:AcrR family transcriptional regulator